MQVIQPMESKMIALHSELLDDYSPLSSQGMFNATLKAHGLYNTFQFVLRLSPAVHRKLASLRLFRLIFMRQSIGGNM